jgi:hypothetical protein
MVIRVWLCSAKAAQRPLDCRLGLFCRVRNRGALPANWVCSAKIHAGTKIRLIGIAGAMRNASKRKKCSRYSRVCARTLAASDAQCKQEKKALPLFPLVSSPLADPSLHRVIARAH